MRTGPGPAPGGRPSGRHATATWPRALLWIVALAGCGSPDGPSGAGSAAASERPPASRRAASDTDGWVTVAAGTALIGSPEDEPCRGADEPRRSVTLTRPFAISVTEVTRGQFRGLMGYDPSFGRGGTDDCPVDSVSWHEAAAYCNALSRREDLPPCYECTGARVGMRCVDSAEPMARCAGYRLPSEAEWEVAARDGSEDSYSGGNVVACMTHDPVTDELGWYKVNSGGVTHPVGEKKANSIGLYDMHGNVAEWTGDWYAASPPDDATDPAGPARGTERVFRGGDWYHNASHARSAHRERFRPEKRFSYVGFRCVVTE